MISKELLFGEPYITSFVMFRSSKLPNQLFTVLSLKVKSEWCIRTLCIGVRESLNTEIDYIVPYLFKYFSYLSSSFSQVGWYNQPQSQRGANFSNAAR